MGAVRRLLFPVPSVLPCIHFPVWLLSILPPLIYSPGREVTLPLYPLCPKQVTRCAIWGVPQNPFPVRGVSPPPSTYHSPSPSPTVPAEGARVNASGMTPPPPSPSCTLGEPAAWLVCHPTPPGYAWEACATVWGSSPPSPWWLHALNARCRSGDPRSCYSFYDWPHARSAR